MSEEILQALRDSVDSYGQTTMMVTHDAAAAAVADRVLFLADGEVVEDEYGLDEHAVLGTMERLAHR
jgi:putative ABC transport system ATP-binding protein